MLKDRITSWAIPGPKSSLSCAKVIKLAERYGTVLQWQKKAGIIKSNIHQYS